MKLFSDRTQAGKELAHHLFRLKPENPVILAVPRGEVVVAHEVAKLIGLNDMGLVVPRKIGHPLDPEYAIGAVTVSGKPVWNKSELGFTEERWRKRAVKTARAEAERRQTAYASARPAQDLTDRTLIIIDDGIATGLTMQAAISEAKGAKARRIVVAGPVAPVDTIETLAAQTDEVVVPNPVDDHFISISSYYQDFPQVSDEEVRQLMGAYRQNFVSVLDVESLNAVLATITSYPITGKEAAETAAHLSAPKGVVHFFESLPAEASLTKREIMERSEEVEKLQQEELNEPDEYLKSYD